MSEPEKPDFAAVSARMRGTFDRMQSWQRSDEGRAHAARAAAVEAEREHAERESLAAKRNVPGNPAVRAVAIARSPVNTPALEAIRTVLSWRHGGPEPRSLGFVLIGPPGNGKTSAISWAVTWHHRPALYALARAIGATPNNGWSENLLALKRWASVDLLAIDELGHEESPEACARVAALLAQRYDDGKATLCAGNLSADQFADRYGNERIVSRLRNEQFRQGLGGGCPYLRELAPDDMRDPLRAAQLEFGNAAR